MGQLRRNTPAAPDNGHNDPNDFIRWHRSIYAWKRIAASHQPLAIARHHAVGHQAPIAQVQNNLSWLDFDWISALDNQVITGPNRREHAAAEDLKLHFAMYARYFGHQFAAYTHA